MKNLKNFIKSYSFLEKAFRPPYEIYKKLKGNLLESYIKFIGIYNGEKRIKLNSIKKSDKIIAEIIRSEKPSMIARYGNTEFQNLTLNDNLWFDNLAVLSGFFPKEKSLLKKFRKIYYEASKNLDVLGVWIYKSSFFRKLFYFRNLKSVQEIIPLEILDPMESSWKKELDGKRILVIHPFKKSIEYQYAKRKEISIIPNFKSIKIIQAVQTIAFEKDDRFKDWFEALEYMKKEIYKKRNSFDVALIGCGAYGFPLASYVKSLGKQGIHLGGFLQLLFGIKGKRWEDFFKRKFPENWIYPLDEDTPKEFKKVEGGCYWK